MGGAAAAAADGANTGCARFVGASPQTLAVVSSIVGVVTGSGSPTAGLVGLGSGASDVWWLVSAHHYTVGGGITYVCVLHI